jgi:hypothetical protein
MQYPHWMLAGAAAAISCFTAQTSRASDDALIASNEPALEKQLHALPASALGVASARGIPAPQARAGDYLGGTAASGRVAAIYLKLAPGLFISLEQAPNHLRHVAERWVDVQFPEALGNGIAEAPALVDANRAHVEVGDAVEIKFAHPMRTSVFPVIEVTRVVAIVAKSHEPLAREFEKRIHVRLEASSNSSIARMAPPASQTAAISAWLGGSAVNGEGGR